jgi:hypothetical protein
MNTESESEIEVWCDEHLPDLYDNGMYDNEDIAEEVWAAVATTANETILEFIDDDGERDTLEDTLMEAARTWFSEHHATTIDALQVSDGPTIRRLCTAPQVEQHTAEWYAQRRNRLTASEFSHILDGRRGALLRSKLATDTDDQNRGKAPVAVAQEDGEMNATSWGHRFESVTRDIYELEIAGVKTVNDTMGRLTHRSVSWLSASPDGLVIAGPLAGRLVEIKSPKSRQPGEFVPMDYYVQMQIQMEVCDVDAVDFIAAQYAQVPLQVGRGTWIEDASGCYGDYSLSESRFLTEEELDKIDAAAWKGRIEVYGYTGDSGSWMYRYSAPVEDLADATFHDPVPDLPLLEHSIWWLTGWHPRTVLRNSAWWDSIGWPQAQLFWAEVESLRTTAKAKATATATDRIQHVGWMGTK